MTYNCVKYLFATYLTPLVLLCGAGPARAQNTPEMREVLTRLERLEQDNHALAEELRALRKELATLHAPDPAPATPVLASTDSSPATVDQPTTDETRSVQQSRIEELAQTKVEASQKFPIRITGMALFNAYVNGRCNNQSENPTIASLTPGDATGGGTLRQSTLGLLFNGPQTFAGGKVSGSVYMDFFGGSTSSLNHLVRLRTAAINLDWTNTSLLFGQDKPIISPRDPDSLAQVGYSPLTGAGNLWLWQPQVRVEQRFSSEAIPVSGRKPVCSKPASSTRSAILTPTPRPSPPQRNTPVRARKAAWSCGNSGAKPAASRSPAAIISIRITSGGSRFRPISTAGLVLAALRKLEFSGMYFQGRNVAILGGLPQGYIFCRATDGCQCAAPAAGPSSGSDDRAAGLRYLWRPARRPKRTWYLAISPRIRVILAT